MSTQSKARRAKARKKATARTPVAAASGKAPVSTAATVASKKTAPTPSSAPATPSKATVRTKAPATSSSKTATKSAAKATTSSARRAAKKTLSKSNAASSPSAKKTPAKTPKARSKSTRRKLQPKAPPLPNPALDAALRALIDDVPQCLGAAYIDMRDKQLLGIQTAKPNPQPITDQLARATATLLQGETVVEIESLFTSERGDSRQDEPYFREVLIASDNFVHLFVRGRTSRAHAVAVICKTHASIGMVIAKVRLALDEVEETVIASGKAGTTRVLTDA